MSEYFDISPALSEDLAVFPGDQPLERRVSMSMAKGDHLELSSLLMTVHCGAHADAPSHYAKAGQTIDQRDLSYYYGPAQVVRLNAVASQRLTIAEWGSRKVLAPRILVCTGTFSNPNHWQADFASFSPELIEYWVGNGVRLIGIDTPSIDPADSKYLESHRVVAENNLAILEGLVLKDVPEGVYQLVALPLRLVGFDASPVRAVLFPT